MGSEDDAAATRRVYDATADAYARTIGTELNPDFDGLDRALLVALAGLGGAVCWYSLIHTRDLVLHALFTELARTLVRGSPLLVAFQTADDERVHRADAHGSGHR